ncbi:MAG: hypothetical protein ABIQ88_21595 [Chitinophagaceae bacterium]
MKTQITNEVKSTLATIFSTTRSKVISVADVWNIQRTKRARVQRRYSL